VQRKKALCAASKKMEAQNKIGGKRFLLQANAFYCRQTIFLQANTFLQATFFIKKNSQR
jgi:3-deoxy-D-manno-octulosonic acid (KDO) 8-phosphate synthase